MAAGSRSAGTRVCHLDIAACCDWAFSIYSHAAAGAPATAGAAHNAWAPGYWRQHSRWLSQWRPYHDVVARPIGQAQVVFACPNTSGDDAITAAAPLLFTTADAHRRRASPICQYVLWRTPGSTRRAFSWRSDSSHCASWWFVGCTLGGPATDHGRLANPTWSYCSNHQQSIGRLFWCTTGCPQASAHRAAQHSERATLACA